MLWAVGDELAPHASLTCSVQASMIVIVDWEQRGSDSPICTLSRAAAGSAAGVCDSGWHCHEDDSGAGNKQQDLVFLVGC